MYLQKVYFIIRSLGELQQGVSQLQATYETGYDSESFPACPPSCIPDFQLPPGFQVHSYCISQTSLPFSFPASLTPAAPGSSELFHTNVCFTQTSLCPFLSSLRSSQPRSDSSTANADGETQRRRHQSAGGVSNIGAEQDEGITSLEIKGQASHTHQNKTTATPGPQYLSPVTP